MSKRKHVFISHHHADDDHVTKFYGHAQSGVDFDLRNSSIRAKPSNQARLDRGQVKDETIKRLLRMKMSWASTVVVIIGKDTHKRPWVDWEIRKANELGKRIVGVYTWGGTEADVPEALNDYESARVNSGIQTASSMRLKERLAGFEDSRRRRATACSRGLHFELLAPVSKVYIYVVRYDFGFAPNRSAECAPARSLQISSAHTDSPIPIWRSAYQRHCSKRVCTLRRTGSEQSRNHTSQHRCRPWTRALTARSGGLVNRLSHASAGILKPANLSFNRIR